MADFVSIKNLGKAVYDTGIAVIQAGTIALNVTAKEARIKLQSEMDSVFDKGATPYTKRGIWVTFATDQKQEARIEVLNRPSSSKVTNPIYFLGPEIEGGIRNQKRSEIALEKAGILDKGNMYSPGPGAELDKFGNINRGQIQKILANTRSFRDTQQRSKKGKTQTYFARSGPIPEGRAGKIVWKRISASEAIPVLFPHKPSTYKPKFDFYGIIDKVYNANLEKNYDIWLKKLWSKQLKI